jgi:hypothetical protein
MNALGLDNPPFFVAAWIRLSLEFERATKVQARAAGDLLTRSAEDCPNVKH